MIDLSKLRKKTLPKALTPRPMSESDRALYGDPSKGDCVTATQVENRKHARSGSQTAATGKLPSVEGEASQSSPSLDLEIEDDPNNP